MSMSITTSDWFQLILLFVQLIKNAVNGVLGCDWYQSCAQQEAKTKFCT